MRPAAFTLSLLAALSAVPALAATPCEAPEQFVRVAKLDVPPASAPAPLLRPYVVAGLAAVAIRDDGGQRWLELAVHSADEARRQLAARGPAADPVVETREARVWLRCPGAAPRA